MNKNTKVLADPLSEASLPNFARLGINHHSSTSLSYPDGVFVYRYIICDQETRRMFEGNANMAAGVACGDALSYRFAKVIWKMNPLTKKLAPVQNKVFTDEEAISSAMEKFRKYNPVNQTDEEKFNHYLETIPQTIKHGFKCINELVGNNHVVCEDVINHIDPRVQLPIVGRTDFRAQDLRGEQSPPGAHHVAKTPLKGDLLSVLPAENSMVLELKTSWSKPMKRKKDGTRSFSSAKLPSLPNKNHLQQLAFYTEATKVKDPKLVYLCEEGYRIFDKNNCADLIPENLKGNYEQLIRAAKRRERLLTRHEHITDTDKMKLELVKDTDAQFDHPFFWKIGNTFLKQAQDLWNQV